MPLQVLLRLTSPPHVYWEGGRGDPSADAGVGREEGDNMGCLVMLVVLVLCAGMIAWELRHRGHVYTTPVLPAAPRETLALQAFTHGNSCLAAGQFADAIAAFHRAREIDPKHPHVAGRLAEVQRRQHTASVTPLGNATV